MVEKFGVLRRSMSPRLAHSLKVASVCIKLHNLGIDNGDYKILPLLKDRKARDDLLPVQQDKVAVKPKNLKSKVKSILRDKLGAMLKE